MAIHLINSFEGGISTRANRGIPGSFKNAANMNIRKFNDTLTVNQVMKKESGTVVTDLIQAVAVSLFGQTYGFGDSGHIYQRAADGTWTYICDDPDGEISGAAEWEGDIYWATSGKLKSTPSGAINFAAPTEVATDLHSDAKHFMKTIAGYLVIANGDYVAAVDTVGAYTAHMCNITPDCTITCLDDRDGYVMAGASKLDAIAESWIFLIDPADFGGDQVSFVKRFRIPADNMHGMITNEGAYCHAGNAIYYTDFISVIPVQKVEESTMLPYGVTTRDATCLFGLYGNTYPGLYTFGRIDKTSNQVLNLEYVLSPDALQISDVNWSTNITQIGAIWTYGDLVLASWSTGATWGVDVIDTANKADGFYESLEYYFNPLLERPIVIEWVKLLMSPLPAGCKLRVHYKVDKNDWVACNVMDSTDYDFTETDAQDVYFALQASAKICYELRIEVEAVSNTAPEIFRIETYITNPPA